MKRFLVSSIILLLILIGGAGYIFIHNYQNHQKVDITASFYPMGYFAEQISGNKLTVHTITPATVEPHDFEPTSNDLRQIEDSKLLIVNGQVEGWSNKLSQNAKVLVAGDGLFNQNKDPHVWLDPILAKKEINKIATAIEDVDSSNKAYYQANEQDLITRLNTLDRDYRTGLADCQEKNIVTSHAAFGYLATRYGLHQEEITGLSPDAEPSSRQLAKITQFVKTNNVSYIFFESLVSPKLAHTIAEETGAKTLELNPLEGLTVDRKEQGADYFSVMYQNLTHLQIALRCQQ